MSDQTAAHLHPWKISDVVMFPLLGVCILAEYLWPTVILGFPNWIAIIMGLVIVVFGFRLINASKVTLDAADQPSLPGVPTTQLLTSGPYRFSRNPNYLGAILIAAGLALAVDSLWFWGGAALGAIILDRWMIGPEEKYLSAAFGSEYDQYRQKVRRWI